MRWSTYNSKILASFFIFENAYLAEHYIKIYGLPSLNNTLYKQKYIQTVRNADYVDGQGLT